MLAFNNQTLEKLPKEHPFLADYNEKIDLLKEMGDTFEFRFTDDKIRPKNPFDPDSREESAAGVSLLTRVRYAWTGGSGEVTYYRSFTMDHGEPLFVPREIPFTGFMTLDIRKDPDLIYFLIFVSPFIEPIPDFKDDEGKSLMNLFRRRSHYKLYLHDAVVDSKYELEEKISEVQTLIYDKNYGLPIAKIRVIASSYSIPGVGFMKDNEVRIALKERILATTRGRHDIKLINDFLTNKDTPEQVVLNSLIQTGIDHDLIRNRVPSQKNPKGAWYYNSEQKELICEVGNMVAPRRALIDFLTSSPDDRKEFERVITEQSEALLNEKASKNIVTRVAGRPGAKKSGSKK